MGEQQLYSMSQLHKLDAASVKETIKDWLVMVRLLLEPEEMSINGEEGIFDLSIMEQTVNSLTANDDRWLQVRRGDEESTVHLLGGTLFEKSLLNQTTYQQWEYVYTDYLEKRLEKHGFFAYTRSHEEYLYHNTSEIDKRRRFESAEKRKRFLKCEV